MYSYLDLVKQTDSVPYPKDVQHNFIQQKCYAFLAHDGIPIGRILPFVVEHLTGFPSVLKVDHDKQTVKISPSMDTVHARSEMLSRVVNEWRRKKTFKVLEGWRDELYAVYNPTHTEYLFIERAAAALFGVITYGVHIVGYVPGPELKLWIPRRSYNKPTFPGMLDNTVAGGIGYPHGIMETVVKECAEEAGLSKEYVLSHIKPAGVISYNHQRENTVELEEGLFQPEVEYVYDLEMEPEVTPKVVDGEVESFELFTIDRVKQELNKGSFKYNTATITIDFFIRHGILTPEEEPDYLEIVQRSHRLLEYPVM